MTAAPSIRGNPIMKGLRKDKPKSILVAWRRIFHYLGRHRTLFMIAMAMVFVESLLTTLAPDYISQMTDLIDEGL